MNDNYKSIMSCDIYKAIVQFVGDGIILSTIAGEIVYVNNEAVTLYGYSEDELLKMNIKQLINSKEKNQAVFKNRELKADGVPFITQHIRKDETYFPVEVKATLIYIKDQKYLLNVIRDMARQNKRKAEISEDIEEDKIDKALCRAMLEELNRKNIELEQTTKMLNDLHMQLTQADKMASIGYLSAGIAHEINNPLGFVSSNFNTLKKYISKFTECMTEYIKFKDTLEVGETEGISEKIDDINKLQTKNKLDFILNDLDALYLDTDKGINRIKNIVLTLKDFVHQSKSTEYEDYNINKGIEETLVIVKNEIKYNIEIVLNLFNDIKCVNANAGEINQVLLNLIINASHAIKEKCNSDSAFTGEIIISTNCDERFVYCSIEDNGAGISSDYIYNIFDPFFTTKPIGVGTGLGLSISYDIIVNKHKGEIEVESEVGKGTRFIITLPIDSKGQA